MSLGSCFYPLKGHGELKIEWNEEHHAEVVNFIQEKMDQKVTFHILDPESKAKKPALLEIENTDQITGHQVYIRDPDIAKIVEAGFASIARFSGTPTIKTVRRAKTAEEAAANETIAVAPKVGG